MDDVLGIGKATEELVKLIDPLFRPGAEAAGEFVADQIKYWRFSRAIALAEKARNILKSKNIEPKSVPLKILVPIFNSGSLEEDEILTSKWAGLLASAAAGDTIHPSYPTILEQLSPDEARMLDMMYQRRIDHPPDERRAFSLGELRTVMITSTEQLQIILGNLKRLELCRIDDDIDRFFSQDANNSYRIDLTGLGMDLIRACRGPS